MISLMRAGWHELRQRPAGQLPALDALRAIAVLLVICTHYALPEWANAGGPSTSLSRLPIFYFGWTGVDLFFVLSGYLIGRQLWKEISRTQRINVPRFLLKRGFRIWPVYFVTLALLLASGRATVRWSDWLFLSNYLGTSYSRGWSLAVEEQFYILVPLILLVAVRFLPVKRHGWVVLALLPCVTVARAMTRARLKTQGLDSHAISDAMIFPIHLHCEALLLGLLLAWAHTFYPGWFQRRSRRGILLFLVAASVGLALDTVDRTLFAFLALGLIFTGAAYFALVDDSRLSRPLRWKVWYPVSRLSYGMYLNHFLIVPGSTVWAVRHVPGPLPLVFLAGLILGTAISFGGAIITFVLVEHPFLALRNGLFSERADSERSAVSLPPGWRWPLLSPVKEGVAEAS